MSYKTPKLYTHIFMDQAQTSRRRVNRRGRRDKPELRSNIKEETDADEGI